MPTCQKLGGWMQLLLRRWANLAVVWQTTGITTPITRDERKDTLYKEHIGRKG